MNKYLMNEWMNEQMNTHVLLSWRLLLQDETNLRIQCVLYDYVESALSEASLHLDRKEQPEQHEQREDEILRSALQQVEYV